MSTQRVRIDQIPGLRYVANFIDEQEAQDLIRFIDSQQWISHEMTDNNSMKRLTQQYGYTYNFATKTLRTDRSEYVPFPSELDFLFKRIQPLYGTTPIQNMIINEYIGSQGITRHLDRTDYFGDIVVSLSLLQPCPFIFYEFEHVDWNKIIGVRSNLTQHTKRRLTGREACTMLVPNSLLTLSGVARYDWQHEIPKHNPILYSDMGLEVYSDQKWFRRDENYRRVSLTFRSVLPKVLNNDLTDN